jgi:CheY-like chemotaxis protein
MNTINHAFLVDDDAVINMVNKRVIELSKLAAKVSSFTSAKEALDLLRNLAYGNQELFPKIIFLDINMPDMDGWGFLNEFIKLPVNVLKETKVVMLTSSIDLFDIRKAKTYPVVNDYIIKPLNVKLLTLLGSPKHQYFGLCQLAVQEI